MYEYAAEHYQEALRVRSLAAEDRLRIEEKVAYSLFQGRDPHAANPWLELALAKALEHPEKADAVELLLQRSRQLWADAQTKEALPVIAQAIQVAERIGNVQLLKLANLRMAGRLQELRRFLEAETFLRAVGGVSDADSASLRAAFYKRRAILAAARGAEREAYENFERAADAAREDTDVFALADVYSVYALKATALGNIELAKSCAERALLAARRNHIAWYVPHGCLQYAALLTKMGQYWSAHHYVIEALAYEPSTPRVEALLAEVGVPLGLKMKDDTLVAGCARSHIVTRMCDEGVGAVVGPVAAAFAQLLVAQGFVRKAQTLLHRVLGMVQSVDENWDLPLMVAKYGAIADVRPARNLLEVRTALPSCDVASAYLSLFDAYVSQREKRVARVREIGTKAMDQFSALHWYAYADAARELMTPEPAAPSFVRPMAALSTIEMLTLREREVAKLALQGLSNSAIASNLAIKERTVEAHMSSILGKLGIRSRYQLAEIAKDSGPPAIVHWPLS